MQADNDFVIKMNSVLAALAANATNKMKRIELFNIVRPVITSPMAIELYDFLKKRASAEAMTLFKFQTISFAEKSRKSESRKEIKKEVKIEQPKKRTMEVVSKTKPKKKCDKTSSLISSIREREFSHIDTPRIAYSSESDSDSD